MFWTVVTVVIVAVLAAGWWVGRGHTPGSFRDSPGDSAVNEAKRQATNNKLSGPGAG